MICQCFEKLETSELQPTASHLIRIYTNDLEFSLGNELIQFSSFVYINKRVNITNNEKCLYIIGKKIYSVVFLAYSVISDINSCH